MPKFHFFGKVTDIPNGEARSGSLNDIRIAVFNLDGDFFALDDRCPHAGASLALGSIENDRVCCRIHHWKFSIKDGTCVEDGNLQSRAQSYPVRIVGDEIQVEI